MAGSLFRQPRLAATLHQLAEEGLDTFYRGALAASIAHDLEALGSPVSLNDLAAYRARRVKPLALQHSAGMVYNLTPPSQGLVSQLILGIADHAGLDNCTADSAEHIHTLVEATKLAFRVRDEHITDPEHMTIDPQA